MMGRKKSNPKIALSIIVSIILGSIAWTNESIDYLGKLGVTGINPGYTLLFTTFIFALSIGWVMWEVFKQ